ncbi:GrpB family protein [Clostridium tagluense]|uniref:GrpB family protein n=1 Tax=Clostridium tagluense TaxID=360422 RepID=UPI001C0C612D|nr:GrpB family protein [Clostridium tagluense]MBU3129976.1 GrpB family protein [Clostridium tagluense]
MFTEIFSKIKKVIKPICFFCCGDFDNDTRTYHIHVVIHNDNEWNNFIKFRDTLNRNIDIINQCENDNYDFNYNFTNNGVFRSYYGRAVWE